MQRAIFLCVFFLVFARTAAADESRNILVGEQASVPVEAGTRFSVGNGEVIQVRPTQLAGGHSLLLVKGKSQGYSDLILLESTGGRRTLAFRVLTKREAGRLAGAKQAAMAVHLHPLERVKMESRIHRRLRDAGISGVEVKSAGSTVLLYGNAQSAGDKELAESLAREVLPGVKSQVRVPVEKGGRLRFHARILEVLKESAQSLGLEWGDTVPNAVQVSGAFSKASFGLDATLKLLEKEGRARVLAQPQLLLNEKGAAELQVGGEIPIPLHSHFFSTVQWKQYGLLLHLDLPGMTRELARAHIVVEITTLDPANGSDGVPALRTSRMDTQVDLAVGRAVMLSGLLESRQSRNLSGIPLLGDIPILGELFRSHDFQENRSELVIVIEADA
jgi:pilus assembly protein CpaC